MASTWRGFFTEWRTYGHVLRLAKALQTEGTKADRSLVLHGLRDGRDLAASLLVRSACTGKRTAAIVDLPRLIDVEFRRDEEDASGSGRQRRGLYAVGLLVVRLGHEPAHRYNRVVLERALKLRWGAVLPTVLLVEGDPSRLATDYRSTEVDEIVGRYHRVQVQKLAAPQVRGGGS